MSTYLQICQDVARECGIAGGADASPKPTAVTGQVGELNRVVNWVADAYAEIQGARDWRWLRKKFTLVTTSGTDNYAFTACTDVETAVAISRFDSWKLNDYRNPPKIYLTSVGTGGEVFMTYANWDDFELVYKTGSLQSQTSFPYTVTVDPKDEIRLAITPNASYTLTGTYHRSAQILAANGDTPEMPAQYHDLIKYQAMEWYGIFESAPEIVSRAQKGMKRIMYQLMKNQAPVFRITGPMV